MRNILYLLLLSISAITASDITVKITKDIPYVNVVDSGTNIKIQRIQDTQNRLTDDFAKTSRMCPPHCVAPMSPYPGVKNVEELEVLSFMKNEISNKTGYLIDAREPSFFKIETIPTAINIPFGLVENADKTKMDKIFNLLGAKTNPDGTLDYSNAKKLIVFCSGVWCLASPKFIATIAKAGYPAEKISYYRSGLQGWKLLSLTTTIRKENIK